ncbi:MAG: hypothetical protein K6E98_12540 [Lachnospiraceae bacterium]|nr:hypothetical protein [Lachnospiraceae bacterium]
MNKSFKPSKSSLFLIEILISTLVLSWGTAACVSCFTNAHTIGIKTKELNHAVAIATGYAEVMRGTNGDIDSIINIYPEAIKGDETYFSVFYNEDFEPCDITDAKYIGDVTLTPNGAIQNMHIKIAKLEDNSVIYELNATKYMNTPKG